MIKYDKTIWENDKTPVNAQHLGKVEDGLEYLFDVIKDVPAGEDARIANEKQRQSNETARQNNELKRNDTLNAKVEEVDNAIAASNNNIKEVNNKFETIVASKQQDAEVILARGKYSSLPTRLDNLDKDLLNIKDTAIIPVVTEKNFETIGETVNGYLKDFKLEGRTLIVNSQNQEVEAGVEGATLKSVGDDVEEIVVSSFNNGNMLNKDMIIKGEYIHKTTGIEVKESNSFTTSYFIDINKNMKIKSSIAIILSYYDKSKQFVSGEEVLAEQYINIPSNAKYMKMSFLNKLNVIDTIVVGISDKINKNINFKSNKKKPLYYDTETQSWKKPTLRELDSIEEHSDSKYYYHKRSSEKVLNGTENFSGGTDLGNVLRFGLDVSNFKAKNAESICDKFAYKVGYSEDTEHFYIQDNYLYLFVDKSKLETQNVEGLKTWLQSNNVTIVYQLAKEEVYECAPIDLIAFENETNYMIECGSVIPKTTFKYEGYIGNVINTLKEKVSYLEDKLYKTNLANFTAALNALDTKLKLEQLTNTPK